MAIRRCFFAEILSIPCYYSKRRRKCQWFSRSRKIFYENFFLCRRAARRTVAHKQTQTIAQPAHPAPQSLIIARRTGILYVIDRAQRTPIMRRRIAERVNRPEPIIVPMPRRDVIQHIVRLHAVKAFAVKAFQSGKMRLNRGKIPLVLRRKIRV